MASEASASAALGGADGEEGRREGGGAVGGEGELGWEGMSMRQVQTALLTELFEFAPIVSKSLLGG